MNVPIRRRPPSASSASTRSGAPGTSSCATSTSPVRVTAEKGQPSSPCAGTSSWPTQLPPGVSANTIVMASLPIGDSISPANGIGSARSVTSGVRASSKVPS